MPRISICGYKFIEALEIRRDVEIMMRAKNLTHHVVTLIADQLPVLSREGLHIFIGPLTAPWNEELSQFIKKEWRGIFYEFIMSECTEIEKPKREAQFILVRADTNKRLSELKQKMQQYHVCMDTELQLIANAFRGKPKKCVIVTTGPSGRSFESSIVSGLKELGIKNIIRDHVEDFIPADEMK